MPRDTPDLRPYRGEILRRSSPHRARAGATQAPARAPRAAIPDRVRLVPGWSAHAARAATTLALSASELVNQMPRFVDALIEDGCGPEAFLRGRQRAYVAAHVAARVREGFELAEVVEEFSVLGKCIATAVDSGPADVRPS